MSDYTVAPKRSIANKIEGRDCHNFFFVAAAMNIYENILMMLGTRRVHSRKLNNLYAMCATGKKKIVEFLFRKKKLKNSNQHEFLPSCHTQFSIFLWVFSSARVFLSLSLNESEWGQSVWGDSELHPKCICWWFIGARLSWLTNAKTSSTNTTKWLSIWRGKKSKQRKLHRQRVESDLHNNPFLLLGMRSDNKE